MSIDNIEVKNIDGMEYLKTIKDKSIDLILTDPPYIISRDSGMNNHYNKVKSNEEKKIEYVKTEEEWRKYKKENNLSDEGRENYLKYGTIYGKKYCVKTDYGDWDNNFTMEELENYVGAYYNKLKSGGTLIMFFDLWKITPLKDIFEKYSSKYVL